jgi:hypothetical protein
VEAARYDDLVRLICPIANRCLRAIRYAGIVPEVHEVFPGDGARQLQRWKAQVSDDGEQWRPLFPEVDDSFLSIFGGAAPQGELHANLWPLIEEFIQDDLPSPPEREFTVNALEHLKSNNLRLAVLEAIIGLEIVLARYVREFLRVYKATPESRIKKFLNPEFGLTAKLAGLLDLTLHETDLRSVDLGKVAAVVNWRITVTNRTGRLPNIPRVQVADHLSAVFKLTFLLAERAEQASASPEIQAIARAIWETHDLATPTIRVLPHHRVAVDFLVFAATTEEMTHEKLEAIIADLIRQLRARDSRFREDQHLTVIFTRFPSELVAGWARGSLTMTGPGPVAPSKPTN